MRLSDRVEALERDGSNPPAWIITSDETDAQRQLAGMAGRDVLVIVTGVPRCD